MKKVLFVLLIAIGAGVAVYYQWLSGREKPPENTLILYGNVEIREVRLAFDGNEHVDEILVEEGDHVVEGQLLARLHNHRLKAEYQRISAELAAAQAEAHAARTSYHRIRRLAEKNLASKDDEDAAEAKSRVADASVDSTKAILSEVELSLKDTELYAPVHGIIRDRIVEPGDFVTPQTPVLTLALNDPVWVRTYLPESRLGQVKPGMPAKIRTDSYPEKTYPGWVGFISPTAEFTPKSVESPDLRTLLVYQMRVFVCNPDNELRLGMPATVILETTQPLANSLVPDRCEKPDKEMIPDEP